MILIRHCAGVMIWCMIVLYFVLLTALGIFLVTQANSFKYEESMKIVGYVCFIICFLSIIILICIF